MPVARTKDHDAIALIIPNGRTTSTLLQVGMPHLHTLYLACCDKQLMQIGSQKLRPSFANSVITIQRIMHGAGIYETGPRRSPTAGITFYFGGQQQSHRTIMAHEYIEALVKNIIAIHAEEQRTLETIAEGVYREWVRLEQRT